MYNTLLDCKRYTERKRQGERERREYTIEGLLWNGIRAFGKRYRLLQKVENDNDYDGILYGSNDGK